MTVSYTHLDVYKRQDEDDAPGVEDIHRRRPAPEGGSGREGQALKPPQEEPDTQGEGEVEGVKAGQGEVLYQQALRRQQHQGEEQPDPVPGLSLIHI